MQLFELADRWVHFGAGVLWIGLLYFFNWVNTAFAPTMDAETKKKVVPELMPRALYWFRWGAAWTWVTGVLLMFLVYYHGYEGSYFWAEQQPKPGFADWGVPFALLLVGFVVYDQLFKLMASQHAVAVVIWGLIAVAFAWFLESRGLSYRATMIHVAALFGTAMAANVWMRIWPAQKRIITATKNGEKPDPADPAMAGLRSKHNTYMSFSLLLFMVATGQVDQVAHFPVVPFVVGVLAIGWVLCWALYAKAKKVPGF